ncbi:YiaA/YiaB family inner membrane protein [Streptomyces sp. NPDC051636]|uniref:YiaA/YiaB family inner membrane protein n=1 Tax=Streptomyces sp. NPDC051636 TaxID=3365663 RepID=UPI00378DE5CC
MSEYAGGCERATSAQACPTSDTPVKQQSTAAFYGQAVASFSIATAATAVGIVRLDADARVRGFVGIAVLHLVTSAFTLAKVIRDRQEAGQIVSRVDQARLEKLLAEHDPFEKV